MCTTSVYDVIKGTTDRSGELNRNERSESIEISGKFRVEFRNVGDP